MAMTFIIGSTLEVVLRLMATTDRWQAAQSLSLLWVGVHPEVPNSQPGSHSLTLVRVDWQGHAVGSALLRCELTPPDSSVLIRYDFSVRDNREHEQQRDEIPLHPWMEAEIAAHG
ncbi:hypothetical protein Q8A73_001936 [Channa argus]|nr:hypothetical protein Q8A73_001936 [Channa argus]